MRPRLAVARVVAPLLLAGSAWFMTCRPGDAEPVAEYPARASGARLALVLTGDDGLTPVMRSLARDLAASGVPSVVFPIAGWSEPPDTTGAVLGAIVRQHLIMWRREGVLLLGNARGAGMAPFVANRMGRDLRDRVDAVILLDPPERVSFHRRWHGPWRAAPHPTDLPLLPELERLRGIRLLCLYQHDDRDAFCPTLDPALVRRERVPQAAPGDRAGDAIAARVMSFVP